MAEAFSSQHTQNFPEFLEQTGMSLLVSTYQAGKLIMLRHQDGVLNTHFVDMQKPMGIALQEPHLAVGTGYQLNHYFNMPDVGARVEPLDAHNACYVPRETHITGDIDIHEMGFTKEGELWLVNTKMSCLCTLNQEHSVVPQWRPPFISGYDLTDRCHLNGLAMRDGKPTYVSALGTTDTAAGWRENKAAGGMLMDIRNNKMIASGLSMPHSPRWYDGQLWVLESGAGSLATVDLETGELTTIVELPGFTRGIDFIDQYAVIGLSQVRETAVFAGLPLTERCQERQCGVYIVDIVEKKVVGFVVFSGEVQEIFSVQLLPSSFPAVLSLDDPLLRSVYSIPEEALKDICEPEPEQQKLEEANILYSQRKFDEAIKAYNQYIKDYPEKTIARLNLAMAYLDSQQWQSAIVSLDTVVAKEPNHADAYNALGRAWGGLRNWQKAKNSYDKAIKIDQQHAVSHYSRALVLLSMGNYIEAWEAFEWRWKISGNQPFDCAQPKWDGKDDIRTKTILIHTEQGNGDLIQFARFLPQLATVCKKVIILCPEPIRLFFKGVEGVDEVRLPGQIANDAFDVFLPIMSLAGIFNATPESLPTKIPYWKVPKEVAVPWLQSTPDMQSDKRLKVGLIWKADPSQQVIKYPPLEDFITALKLDESVVLYSLQTPLASEELKMLEDNKITNLEPEMVSYAHAGALIEQLDILICTDSSFAHLSASLGKKTWLLLDNNPSWVWAEKEGKSIWYPDIELFVQKEAGDWEAVMSQVATRLLN